MLGRLALILHSHLPYVLGHGTWPHGTDWLLEAAAETYVPLLDALYRLHSDGIPCAITVGITPVLAEQMADGRFKTAFSEYCALKIQSAKEDAVQFAKIGDPLEKVAHWWEKFYGDIKDSFENRYYRDLLGAFRALQGEAGLEIITSMATHCYSPLVLEDECLAAQCRTGVETYRRHFGRDPRGFWLPECAYRPRYAWDPPMGTGIQRAAKERKGVDEILSEHHLDYFMVDTHLLAGGRASGVYAARFPALKRLWEQAQQQQEALPMNLTQYEAHLVNTSETPKKPVAFLTRDDKTGLQVWSGDVGYPGDGRYLEFHKKHWPGGLRYWRVTGSEVDLGAKQPYSPQESLEAIGPQADHFVSLAKDCLRQHLSETGRPGVICAPYDAELFGHWWFEGIAWLEQVVRRLNEEPELSACTGSVAAEEFQSGTVVSLPEGSWGEGGFHWVWLNEWTQWTWREVYKAELGMRSIAERLSESRSPSAWKGEEGCSGSQGELCERIAAQCARELLLLESSDWQFLITTWSARDYAEMRCADHAAIFSRLADMFDQAVSGAAVSREDMAFLEQAEEQDRLFPNVDPAWWADGCAED